MSPIHNKLIFFPSLKFWNRLLIFSFITFFCVLLLVFHFQHLETVIRQRIPSIIALINKTIDELNAELDRIGRPIAVDSGVRKDNDENVRFLNGCNFSVVPAVLIPSCCLYMQAQLYTILELCRAFDRIFKEHLDGG